MNKRKNTSLLIEVATIMGWKHLTIDAPNGLYGHLGSNFRQPVPDYTGADSAKLKQYLRENGYGYKTGFLHASQRSYARLYTGGKVAPPLYYGETEELALCYALTGYKKVTAPKEEDLNRIAKNKEKMKDVEVAAVQRVRMLNPKWYEKTKFEQERLVIKAMVEIGIPPDMREAMGQYLDELYHIRGAVLLLADTVGITYGKRQKSDTILGLIVSQAVENYEARGGCDLEDWERGENV